MKKIYQSLLFLLVAAVPFLTSCEDDNDSNPTLSFPTSFVLNTPGLANNVYDLPNGTVNLTTNQPDYGGWPAAVIYAVQVSLTGADDSWTELGTTSTTTKIQASGDEINTAVLNAYRAAHDDENPVGALPIYLRLRASLANSSRTFQDVFSNAVQINVLAYEPPVELALPTSIYVCGNSIADAWSTWKPVPPIWTKTGQFYTLVYNNADGFKWGTKPNEWLGYDKIDTFDNQVEGMTISVDGDGNIVFDKAGWYVLKFQAAIEGKKVKYTLTVAEGKAFVIGAAVDNASWTAGSGGEMIPPASKDGNWTFSDWTGSGELRAYIQVPGADWWMTEFTVVDGNCVWRDAEHNCNDNWNNDVGPEYSIQVGPGKTLNVCFDNNTGYVE